MAKMASLHAELNSLNETDYTRGFRAGADFARAEERQRVLEIMSDDLWHFIAYGSDDHPACLACAMMSRIKGENK